MRPPRKSEIAAARQRAMLERCEKLLTGLAMRLDAWEASPWSSEMKASMSAQAVKLREGADKIRKLLNGEAES